MRRKRLLILLAFGLLIGVIGVYANHTTTVVHRGIVEVDTAPCTATDIGNCQKVALGHLATALKTYPYKSQYIVRWSGKWLFPDVDDYDYFEVIYDCQSHDLTENNVGNATMDYCDHVTNQIIYKAANSPGGFKAIARYGGAEHTP